jgi:nitroreductase
MATMKAPRLLVDTSRSQDLLRHQSRTQKSSSATDAVRRRRSHSKVGDQAPNSAELEQLVSLLNSVPDHSRLRPWRIIALRGEARDRIAHGLALADNPDKLEKYLRKAHRAPLVLAIVVVPQESRKVPTWEQEAVAAGVAHTLSLLLWDAGWGSMWRTGIYARSEAVHAELELAPEEYLLGWLYVGSIDADGNETSAEDQKPRRPLDLEQHLSDISYR